MAPRATWQLEKYARYVVTKKGTTSGEWKYYSDKPCQRLVMTLTDTEHLVICHGSCILESHSLVTARAWMRGLSKTDSLLLMYKYKDGTRRFRVKFCRSRLQTGSSVCAEAADTLSKFFPVKVTEEQVMQSADKNQVRGQPAAVLSGEVTLGVLAETLLSGKNNEVLSAAYKGSS
ncbi:meiotic recombination protein REC114-like isoform X1 [Pomacea canaliculata]|uniref:meiotic recombination protein REC114-like isoform X1 n=1 Tax=Pomacea canaliculata TaxID=400727 RepID=UPI000D72C3D4|nr:meiotic recombination protein REC114-like isoform X1 [Pomacea canaliculata]